MDNITIDELMDNLNSKNIELYCKGIITTNIKIKKIKIIKTEDYLEFYSNNTKDENVKINLHQIMKIIKISSNIYNIQFDGLQTINILVF